MGDSRRSPRPPTRRVPGVSTAATLRLLASERPEVVCGAALVFGALRPTDRRVVPALVRAMDAAPETARPYVVEALARQDDPRAHRPLLRMLFDRGTVREQAIRAVAAQGAAILPRLERAFSRAEGHERIAVVRAAALIAVPETAERLADWLEKADTELTHRFATVLDRRLKDAPRDWRHALARALARRLPEADPETQVAMLRLLTAARVPATVSSILPLVAREEDARVRPRALEALGAVPLPARLRPRVVRRLVALLDDTEEPVHVRNLALAALRPLRPCPIPLPTLLALVSSDQPHFVRTALRLLGEHPKEEVLPTLLTALADPDENRFAHAHAGLVRLEDALADLVAAHDRFENPETRARLRRIIESRSDRGTQPPRPALVRSLLRPDTEAAGAAPREERLRLLAALDRERANSAAERRARAALDAGDSGEAIEVLEALVRYRLATPTGRYLLAIAHFLAMPHDGAEGDPHHDRARNLLVPLARRPEARLAQRLAREKRLDGGRLDLARRLVAGARRG